MNIAHTICLLSCSIITLCAIIGCLIVTDNEYDPDELSPVEHTAVLPIVQGIPYMAQQGTHNHTTHTHPSQFQPDHMSYNYYEINRYPSQT